MNILYQKNNIHIKFSISISTCKIMYFKQLYIYIMVNGKKKIGVVVREGRFYFAI